MHTTLCRVALPVVRFRVSLFSLGFLVSRRRSVCLFAFLVIPTLLFALQALLLQLQLLFLIETLVLLSLVLSLQPLPLQQLLLLFLLLLQ